MARQTLVLILAVSMAAGLASVKISSQAESTNLLKIMSTAAMASTGWIDYVPWSVFVTSSNRTCSGIVLHRDWVLLLQTCNIVGDETDTGLDIEVHAGGGTPESVQQTVKAEIYHGDLNGSTVLHLNTSLNFNEHVAPVRFPSVSLPTTNYYPGIVAGFYSKTNDTHLAGYQATIFSSLCPEGEHLCAFGLDWPGYNETTLGTDFLHLNDAEDGYLLLCTMGVRKSQIRDNIVSYYPTFDMLPWIQQNLGLKLEPTGPHPEPLCGFLK